MQNEIRVRVGDKFTIKLEGFPASGYVWEIMTTIENLHQVKLMETYSNTDRSFVGGPAIKNFVFKALSVGSLTIGFRHSRPWEKDTYLEDRKFNIQIID